MEVKAFAEKFTQGPFTSTRRWIDLDELWQRVREQQEKAWYLYVVGEEPPLQPASPEQTFTFIEEVTRLLHEEHEEDYCGIVYADSLDDPSFIKIYDPNDLGTACGSSGYQTLPGWLMTLEPPQNLEHAIKPPKSRQRWWKNIFS